MIRTQLDRGSREASYVSSKEATGDVALRKTVTAYFHDYYERLREELRSYRAIPSVFPAFLRDPAAVTVLIVDDGVIAIHRRAIEQRIKGKRVAESIESVAEDFSRFDKQLPLKNLRLGSLGQQQRPFEWTFAIEPIDKHGYVLPWVRIVVSTHRELEHWSTQQAEETARNDIAAFITGHLMGVPIADDPSKHREDIHLRLDRVIEEMIDLLEQKPLEETIQTFLGANPVILEPAAVRVIPKQKLGKDYITDFVIERANREYVLVEIEPSSHPLFTKAGDPSAKLTHAIRQGKDWRAWVLENIRYLRDDLIGIHQAEVWVVIGRRDGLTEADQRRLAQINADDVGLSVFTYDDLIDRARQLSKNLGAASDTNAVN